jgi:hypothetical protein
VKTPGEQLRVRAIKAMARANKIADDIRDAWVREGDTLEQVVFDVLNILENRARPAGCLARPPIAPKELLRIAVRYSRMQRRARAIVRGDFRAHDAPRLKRAAADLREHGVVKRAADRRVAASVLEHQTFLYFLDIEVANAIGGEELVREHFRRHVKTDERHAAKMLRRIEAALDRFATSQAVKVCKVGALRITRRHVPGLLKLRERYRFMVVSDDAAQYLQKATAR